MTAVSSYLIILFIAFTLLYGAVKKVNCFEAFTDGAKTGLDIGIKILPTLCAMLVAVSVLKASGVFDALVSVLKPVANFIGLPAEVLPLVIVRPFSGSASMGVLLGVLQVYGVDSRIGMASCIIMGSSESLVYIAGLYYGSIGVQKWRHTLPLCFLGTIVSCVMASFLTKGM